MIRRILSLIFVMTSVAFAQKGIPSKVTFIIRNDAGQPVKNIAVEGGFLDFSQSGARDRFKGVIDTNGIYIAKGNAVLGVCAGFSSAGFYPTEIKQNIEYKRRDDGKGYESIDRWDVEMPVLLKRIRNPIEMRMTTIVNAEIRKQTGDKIGRIVTNSIVGYDLVRGDMVAPYGSGQVTDVQLRWQMKIISADGDNLPVDCDTLFEMRFSNIADGICKGIPDGGKGNSRDQGSAYISAYEAPTDGYTNAISLYRNVRGTKAESNDDHHYLYYFRIRTQTNEFGQVTNAQYGKIYGQINENFTFLLNPTPNERNVEEKRKFY